MLDNSDDSARAGAEALRDHLLVHLLEATRERVGDVHTHRQQNLQQSQHLYFEILRDGRSVVSVEDLGYWLPQLRV